MTASNHPNAPAIFDEAVAKQRVAAYLSPRNVVIVGASDRPGSWAARVYRNLKRYDFPGEIHFINPSRKELAGQPCHEGFEQLPVVPDHVLILTPAPTAPDIIRRSAAAGARSATVYSAGFGEGSNGDAADLGLELRRAIDETGMAVTGPNCMGSVSGPFRFVCLTEDRNLLVNRGPVALMGQSGGVMMFVNQALEERGLQTGYIITNGNSAGLTSADFIAFFASQPEIKVIVIYVEGMRDIERFRAACNLAFDAGKHVIAIKLGATAGGRSAAMAHTGSLAGKMEAFDAVTADMGVLLAKTLDDVIEMTELLCYTGAPKGSRVGTITLSGAYRGLLIDAADHAGVTFPPLAAETADKLSRILGVGSLIGNPVDGGFGVLSSETNYLASIDALEEDPNIDMILVQDSLPRAPGYDRAERYINLVQNHVGGKQRKPLAFVTLTSHGQTDYSRMLRSMIPDISFLQEANKSLRAVACVADRAVRRRLARSVPPVEIDTARQAACLQLLEGSSGTVLDEAASRALVAYYGIKGPKDAIVESELEAVAAAEEIGFPVVLKILSSTISHKSDIGGVVLNINSPEELTSAWRMILQRLDRHGVRQASSRFLVAQYVAGGQEVTLGLHRDSESGPVVMIGSGGVHLELYRDIAFGAPPFSREKADVILASTKVSRILSGYRGDHSYDREAIISAIVAMGQIAMELGDQIQSIDINPLLVMPGKGGCLALDALVVT